MDSRLRNAVRRRANDRCEYCHLSADHERFHPFHAEHIVARQHGGKDELENLAWACHHCNLHKGPNLTGIDPDSGKVRRLFHPRRDRWEDHFAVEGPRIVGRTPLGRTTVWVLQMDAAERVALRRWLIALGEWE